MNNLNLDCGVCRSGSGSRSQIRCGSGNRSGSKSKSRSGSKSGSKSESGSSRRSMSGSDGGIREVHVKQPDEITKEKPSLSCTTEEPLLSLSISLESRVLHMLSLIID